MAALTFSVANSAQISSRDFMVRHHKQDQPVGDRRSTPEETNQFFHDLGAEIGDVGRVLAGGVDHLVASATNRAASEQQGGKRDARQAPADEYKEPEANYEAPADSYQEPDPSYSVPTVPPVGTGYVNPQAPTDKPLLSGIVDGIGNVFSTVFKAGQPAADSANYAAPDPSYSEPNVAPPVDAYATPDPNYTPGGAAPPLQGARIKKQATSGFLQVPGKPPLPEKFRQDVKSAVFGAMGMVGLGPAKNLPKQEVGPTEPSEMGLMMKDAYDMIRVVQNYYYGHMKNALFSTRDMVKPAIDHVETAANKMMFLMPPIPGVGKSSSLAKSAFNPTASALPQVQSYFDPEQGVEYWFDPQAKQWYYHYPEGSDSVAKSSNKGDSDIEPSTQVEVVENSETGLPEWAIVNQENQALVDQALNEILDTGASVLSPAKVIADEKKDVEVEAEARNDKVGEDEAPLVGELVVEEITETEAKEDPIKKETNDEE